MSFANPLAGLSGDEGEEEVLVRGCGVPLDELHEKLLELYPEEEEEEEEYDYI